jgi:hypothetical protein
MRKEGEGKTTILYDSSGAIAIIEYIEYIIWDNPRTPPTNKFNILFPFNVEIKK